MGIDSFLDHFDFIDRILDGGIGLVLSLLPYQPTRKGHPTGEWRIDPGLWEIRIARGPEYNQSGGQAEQLLGEVGIGVWSRRVTDDEFIMSVRRRQARWAERVLLGRNIIFSPAHQWFDNRNVGWANRSGAVRTWASRRRRDGQ